MSKADQDNPSRPIRKRFTLADAWKAAAYPPANPSPKEKAYLDSLDRQEALQKTREREWPRLLLEDAKKKAMQAEASRVRNDRLKLLRQARVLENMAACLGDSLEREQDLTRLLNTSPVEAKEVGDQVQKYGKIVMRAVRNGLLNHPVVAAFIHGQVLTANRALLRRARCGLETRVKTYEYPNEIDIDSEIVLQHLKGRSLRQIEGFLKDNALLRPGQSLSHTAIDKRLKRLQQELPWFKKAVSICQSVSSQKL